MNLIKICVCFAAVFNEVWCHPCGPQDGRPCRQVSNFFPSNLHGFNFSSKWIHSQLNNLGSTILITHDNHYQKHTFQNQQIAKQSPRLKLKPISTQPSRIIALCNGCSTLVMIPTKVSVFLFCSNLVYILGLWQCVRCGLRSSSSREAKRVHIHQPWWASKCNSVDM